MLRGLPDNAKKVFEGVIFDVWQWPQEFFDGSIGTFEVLTRPDTVCVLPVLNGEVVVAVEEQSASKPFATLIAGRVDPGEGALDAAKRELREETGLASDDWELFKIYEHKGKVRSSTYVFIARGCRKVGQQQLDPGEKIETVSLAFDAFVEFCARDDFRISEFALDILRWKSFSPKKLQGLKDRLGVV